MQRYRLGAAAAIFASAAFLPETVALADAPPEDADVRPAIESIHHESANDPPDPPYPIPPFSAFQKDRLPVRGAVHMVQVNVDADGGNIPNDAANEPSIAVDPTDPSRMVIGWRQFDTVLDSFRRAGWAYSHNSGAAWTFPGSLEPDVFRSDPVMGVDSDGVFYYCSLRGDFSVHFFISQDAGVTWSTPIPAFGGDKQWLAIDRTGGVGNGNIYLSWSSAAGCCDTRVFTRSTDGGSTYMEPMVVPGNPIFGTLAVGPQGQVYVVGVASTPLSPGVFPFARSSNAQNSEEPPVFEFDTVVNLGGDLSLFNPSSPNPDGLLGQIWVAADRSDGPLRGNVYMLASVDPLGSDPLDVMFTRSSDGGETWTFPVRLNDDFAGSDTWQWFGTMSVAPNGRIDVFWNDTRNDPNATFSELFYTSSFDGGDTWTPNQPVSPPFNHFLGYPQQNKLGDYYHSVSDATGANLAFAATFNGEQDVYYVRFDLTPGDGDGDGDVDLLDYAAFSACVTGPTVPVGATCAAFDLDDDGDVDLGDFGRFQDAFTGACAAAITVQPGDTSACVDGQAVFQVEAEGSALTYQWSRNGTNIAGANDPTLVIDPVTAESAGSYAVFIQSQCGVALSDFATLDVAPEPVVLSQPENVTTCVGASVAFAVEAGSGVPPFLFQWQRDGVDLPGETEPTLTIASVSDQDAGMYRCVVVDQCDATVVSQPAELHIAHVVFTIQPAGGSVCAGGVIFLIASATDFPAYQWLKDGAAIEGATQAFLTVPDADATDTGHYSVVATGMCDTATSDEAFVEVVDCGGGP